MGFLGDMYTAMSTLEQVSVGSFSEPEKFCPRNVCVSPVSEAPS